jgi:hypothetical protein
VAEVTGWDYKRKFDFAEEKKLMTMNWGISEEDGSE